MTLFGWDASDFDWSRGPMDIAAAAADGISFFTHKATESTNVTHRQFGTAVARARDAGIPFVGAYWVPRTPGNGGAGSVAAQVDFFLSYVDKHAGWWRDFDGWFFQVDLEHWGYDNVAPVHGLQGCELVRQRTGRAALLYAPAWAYGNSIGGTDPLWASNYGGNPTVPYRDAYPGDGSSRWAAYSGRTPAILQFGSNCTIGRQPGCDANAFRGSPNDFANLIGAEMYEELDRTRIIEGGLDARNVLHFRLRAAMDSEDPALKEAFPADWDRGVGNKQLLAAIEKVQAGGVDATTVGAYLVEHLDYGKLAEAVRAVVRAEVRAAEHDAAQAEADALR